MPLSIVFRSLRNPRQSAHSRSLPDADRATFFFFFFFKKKKKIFFPITLSPWPFAFYAATTSQGKLRDFRTPRMLIRSLSIPSRRSRDSRAGRRRRQFPRQRHAKGDLLLALCARPTGTGRRFGTGSGCAWRRARGSLRPFCRRLRAGGLARRQRQYRCVEQHGALQRLAGMPAAAAYGALPLRAGCSAGRRSSCTRRRALWKG